MLKVLRSRLNLKTERLKRLLIFLMVIGIVAGAVLPYRFAQAATTVWNFGSSSDYSVSDSTLAEVASSSARLKTRSYTSDANTAALYHLDEASGSSAADSSSNNNTGTVTGGTFGSGKLNNGLTFDGSDDRIRAGDSASLSLSQANTVEAWTKFSSAFSANSHDQRQTVATKGEYQLYYDNQTGKINYELASANPTWSQAAGNGTNNSWEVDDRDRVQVLTTIGTDLYAGLGAQGADSEVWKYNGTIWTKIGGDGVNSSWTTQAAVLAFAVNGSTLYAALGTGGGDGEVWSWNGTTWTKIGGDGVNSSWTQAGDIEDSFSLVYDGTFLYAGNGNSAGDADVWRWNGTSWTQIGGDGLNSGWASSTYEGVRSLVSLGGNLYAGLSDSTGDAEVWKWGGSSWTRIGGDAVNSSWADATYERVASLVSDGTDLYAGIGTGSGDGEVWKYSVSGGTWTKIGGDGLNSGWDSSSVEIVLSMTYMGGNLYVGHGTGTGDADVWKWNGTAWSQIGGDNLNSGWGSNLYNFAEVDAMYNDGTNVYAGVGVNAGSQVWSWNGTAWSQIGGSYIKSSWGFQGVNDIHRMVVSSGKLYAGTGSDAGEGIVEEFDGTSWSVIGGNGINSSWTQNTIERVESMASFGGNLYVGLGTTTGDADVWKYDGASWSQVGGDALNSGWAASTYERVRALTVYNNVLYAGLGTSTGDAEVWGWNGSTWTKIGGDSLNSGFSGSYEEVYSMVSFGGNLYAGLASSTGDDEVWKWNGSTWTKVGGDGVNSSWDGTGNNIHNYVYSMVIFDGKLVVSFGNGNTGVWSFDGTTWTKIGGHGVNSSWNNSEQSARLAVYNGDLYAGLGDTVGSATVWKYDGSSWTQVGGNGTNNSFNVNVDEIHALIVYQGKLYVSMGNSSGADAMVWSYGNNSVLQSTSTSQDTGWHHIAGTYDGSTMKLYIDGTLNNSLSVTQSLADSAHPLSIGAGLGSIGSDLPSGYFAGSLDEVRISNTARSSFITSTYSASAQTAQPTAAVLTSGVKSWDGFTDTETLNGGTITFRISSDNGTTWKYWNGSAWATSSSTSNANAASVINTNIPTFPVTTGGLLWQAILTGSGEQQVTLNSVTVSYTADTTAPTNPTSTTATNTNGGNVTLTTNTWYNYSSPYFSWSGATDTSGSGVGGYFVYFGTDNTADPATAGTFQAANTYTAASLVSGSTYYLRIKTRDNAQNVSATTYAPFIYKYDVTAPTAPAFISVNPSGYSANNSFTFLWPSTGSDAAADTHSGIAGYQYKTGASSGTYSTYSSTITGSTVTLADSAYQEGSNTFYLRAIDTAGNASDPITATFYYNASAPTAPQDLTATPTSNTSNSFAFSWSAPATFQGNASELTYLYSVNTLPSVNTVTSNGNSTSLSAGPYATQQGDNTLYVVTKDAAGNVNYSAYASVTFTASTTAPGQPLNITISDTSNRATGKYRLSVAWETPTSGGTVSQYKVFRSTNGTSFSQIGTTTATAYTDTELSNETTYTYKVTAYDDAGSASVDSATVSKKPTGKYSEPPKIIGQVKVAAGSTSATVEWTTERIADSFIEYGTSKNYNLNVGAREQTVEHTVKLVGLTPGTIYHYRVQSIDEADIRDYESTAGRTDDTTFETAPAPGLTNVAFTDITTNSAILTFETTKAAVSTIEYGTSTNYGKTITDESSGSTTKHSIHLKDLDDGTTYQIRITIKDVDNNSIESPGHAFTTIAKPRISNVRFESLPNEAQTSVKATWTTNVPTTGAVTYASDKGEKKEAASSKYDTNHEFIVSGLHDQSIYKLQAISRDQFGNEAASDTNTFTTPLDSRPPQAKNLTVEIRASGVGAGQKAQIIASWETDEPSTSQVEYGPGISSVSYPSKSQEDAVLTTSHVVIVSELEPAKLYHLRAVFKDQAGNIGTSRDTTAITGKIQHSVIDVILNSMQRSFGFLGRLKILQGR